MSGRCRCVRLPNKQGLTVECHLGVSTHRRHVSRLKSCTVTRARTGVYTLPRCRDYHSQTFCSPGFALDPIIPGYAQNTHVHVPYITSAQSTANPSRVTIHPHGADVGGAHSNFTVDFSYSTHFLHVHVCVETLSTLCSQRN